MTSKLTKVALASLLTVAVVWAGGRAGAGTGQVAKGPGTPPPQVKKHDRKPPSQTTGGGGPGTAAAEKGAAEKGATEKGTADKGTAEKETTEKGTTGTSATTPATAPSIILKPESIDFGKQLVGSSSVVQTITVTAGPVPIKVVNVKVSGDFSTDAGACDSQLLAGAACALTVRFAPKQPRVTHASITITTQPDTGPRIVALTGEGTASCPNVPSWTWSEPITQMLSFVLDSVAPVLAVVLVFLLMLMSIRWHMIAVPTRRLVESAIEFVRSRVEAVKAASSPPPPGIDNITALLSNASAVVTGRNERWKDTLADYLFWNRGREIAAWGYVHEAEEQLVSFLTADSVRAALEQAESDLSQAGTQPAVALADRIHEALVATPALPVDKCRPLLTQVLAFLPRLEADLSDRVCRALDPKSSATIADYQTILQDAATALERTAATKLADQIDEALKATEPAVGTLTQLLQQASSLLDPRTAEALAATIRTTLANPPATVELWKPILGEICGYFKPQAAALAESIRQALATEPAVPIGRWKALLYEALGLLYDRADTSFSTLISWHNKAVYLVACGLLLIVSLAVGLQHGVLFLVGATGGLLSRLTRALYRADVPTDYGASWTSLFLSPVVGALMGWAGILLVILAVEFKVLGDVFKVDWCNPYSPVALGLAFVLGFSERFFNRIMSQLEDKVQAKSTTSQSSPAAATSPGPKVTSIAPTSGPAAGGRQVTITGTDFADGAKVNIGGVPATGVKWTSKSSITATTPPHAVGSADVEVVNADGQKNALPDGYQYV